MISEYWEMHMESQQLLSNVTNFIIIREVPLVFLHLYMASNMIFPRYQKHYIWVQVYQGKVIKTSIYWTIYYIFQHLLHAEKYTHLLYVYIWASYCLYFINLFQIRIATWNQRMKWETFKQSKLSRWKLYSHKYILLCDFHRE